MACATRSIPVPGRCGGDASESARGDRPDRAFPTDTERVNAVRGMNFHVAAGEVVALVGESGSGKSATAMAIIGLLPEYAEVSGSIRLHGDELFGLVRQSNVADPRQVHRHGVPGPDVGAHTRLHRGRSDRRGAGGSQPRYRQTGRPYQGRRTTRTGRHRPAGPPGPLLPARTLRWRTPTRGDRDRHCQRS